MIGNTKISTLWKYACWLIFAGVVLSIVVSVACSPDISGTATDYLLSFLPDGDFTVERGIPYVSSGDRQQTGDLYLPKVGAGAHPAVVLVHGGSWATGNKLDISEVTTARYLAKRGIAAFVIDYRLVGAGGEFPNDVLDVRSAIEFLLANKNRWNLDPSNFIVEGSSSGATAAMMANYAALTDQVKTGERGDKSGRTHSVKAVISFSGPTDLVKLSSNPYLKKYLNIPDSTAGAALLNKRCAEASPLSYASTAIPTVFVHGTEDKNVPIDQAVEIISALEKNRIPCRFIRVVGADHTIGIQSRKMVLDQAFAFIKQLPTR